VFRYDLAWEFRCRPSSRSAKHSSFYDGPTHNCRRAVPRSYEQSDGIDAPRAPGETISEVRILDGVSRCRLGLPPDSPRSLARIRRERSWGKAPPRLGVQ